MLQQVGALEFRQCSLKADAQTWDDEFHAPLVGAGLSRLPAAERFFEVPNRLYHRFYPLSGFRGGDAVDESLFLLFFQRNVNRDASVRGVDADLVAQNRPFGGGADGIDRFYGHLDLLSL